MPWWSSGLLQSTTRLVPRIRIELFAIVLLGLAALTVGMSEAPLVDWDEATYAEVAHEAVGSGSYLHLTWNGDPYLKKPPLLFWMVMGSFRTFGESAWAARLPSVAAGIGTLLLLYFSAAAVVGRLGGLFAGLLPLGFYFFIARGGRECATDGPLVFFSTLAVFALTRARTDRRWLPVIGVASGLAILSKGVAGLLPLGVTALTVVLVPGFDAVGFAGLTLVAGLTLAVIAPWLIYELGANGPLFWEVFIKQETLFRVASHIELQRQTAAATLPTFFREVRYLWVVALPLGGLIAAAVKRGSRLSLRQLPTRGAGVVVMVGAGARGGLRGADQARLVCSAGAAADGVAVRVDTGGRAPRRYARPRLYAPARRARARDSGGRDARSLAAYQPRLSRRAGTQPAELRAWPARPRPLHGAW